MSKNKLGSLLKKINKLKDEWIFLSLMKCPDCGRNRVFQKILDCSGCPIETILVCYNCGFSKRENVIGGMR